MTQTRKSKGAVRIKTFTEAHIGDALRIARAYASEGSVEYWEERFKDYLKRYPVGCLIAEVDGKNVGFIISEVRGWQFNLPEPVGWIETLGIDRGYTKRGVGAQLVQHLLNHFKTIGIAKVNTAVRWTAADLLGLYGALGFGRGEFISLEKETGAKSPKAPMADDKEEEPFRRA